MISATKQPKIQHVPLVATNGLLSESPNSIFGTSFFLREMMKSLWGTNKLVFTGHMNSLLKEIKLAFLGNIKCKTNVIVADHTNSAKLVLWEDVIDKVDSSKS